MYSRNLTVKREKKANRQTNKQTNKQYIVSVEINFVEKYARAFCRFISNRSPSARDRSEMFPMMDASCRAI